MKTEIGQHGFTIQQVTFVDTNRTSDKVLLLHVYNSQKENITSARASFYSLQD